MKHQIAIIIVLAALFFTTERAKGQGTSTLNASSLPSSVLAGQLDTNIFNTNGLVLPEDVQLLIQDLRVNMSQVAPLLAILNGENPAAEPDTENPANRPSGPVASSQPAPNFGRNFGHSAAQNLGQNSGVTPGAPPAPLVVPAPTPATATPGASGTNGVALVYALGAALEDVQADLQELLPRLALLAGQTNYSKSAVSPQGLTVPPAGTTGTPTPPSPPPAPKR
jgi:hypothetical protein